MRRRVIGRAVLTSCSLLFFCDLLLPQARLLFPNEFLIARHTFFDFGPPTDFYELFIARPIASGTEVERITVTPPADVCFAPAKTEVASASLSQTPAELLGSENPCTIREKDLRRELKRCKNCLVFSGAKVVMQVPCGTQARLIRSDILDKDWFAANPRTPEHTSWTMRLLQRLDSALGPSVIETQRILPLPEDGEPSVSTSDSVTLRDLAAGKYDALFEGAPDKLSELYRASQIPSAAPRIRLVRSVPLQPDTSVEPTYPPLARLAHIEGTLTFTVAVDREGGTTNLVFESGHPLLRGVVADAVKTWRFPKESAGQQVEAAIDFNLNCPRKK